jgi:hypothetical protein
MSLRLADKKILLVMKTTKYDRVNLSNKTVSPYIENMLLNVWKDATQVHYDVAMDCHQHLLQ